MSIKNRRHTSSPIIMINGCLGFRCAMNMPKHMHKSFSSSWEAMSQCANICTRMSSTVSALSLTRFIERLINDVLPLAAAKLPRRLLGLKQHPRPLVG